MNVQDIIEQKLGTHADLVNIEAKQDRFIIKMKKRVDNAIWREIANTIENLGGKWFFGNDSHGEIPFKQDMLIAEPTHGSLILDFETLLKQGYKKLTVKWEK